MAGYTPELATVVWVGRATPGPIRDAAGRPIAGDGLPVGLWRGFMSTALDGRPPVTLPAPAHVGRTDAGDAGKVKRNPTGTGSNTSALTLVDRTRSGGKSLALTFDDGPANDTAAVLDLLGQYHVPATFCMVGEQIPGYKEVVRRIVADGHALCDHSMHHDDQATLTTEQITADLSGMLAAVRDAAPAARVDYYRAPYGSWGGSVKVGATLGLTPLTWTVDPEDWDTPGVDAIVQGVREQLKPGGVVLMHDGGGDRAETLAALRILIPQLLAEGWKFDLPAQTVAPVPFAPTQGATPGTSASPGGTAGQPSASASSAGPAPSGSTGASGSGRPSTSGSAEPSGAGSARTP